MLVHDVKTKRCKNYCQIENFLQEINAWLIIFFITHNNYEHIVSSINWTCKLWSQMLIILLFWLKSVFYFHSEQKIILFRLETSQPSRFFDPFYTTIFWQLSNWYYSNFKWFSSLAALAWIAFDPLLILKYI